MNGQTVRPVREPPGVMELVEEARDAEHQARHGVARGRYEAALKLLRDRAHAGLASALIRWVGRTHASEGSLDVAIDCYETALAVAIAAGSKADAAYAVNCQANVAFARGRLDEATQLYESARDLAQAGGETRLVAMIHQNLGNVANIHGDFSLAREEYQSSLAEYRRLDLKEYLGPLLSNLGRLHTDLGEWDEAESDLDAALAICREVGDRSNEILVQVNRTRLWLTRGDLGQARDCSDAAHDLTSVLDDDRWLGEIHKNYGIIFRESGRFGLSEESLGRAFSVARRHEDLLLLAEVDRELADLYRRQDRNREMLECLTRAQRAFAELKARPNLADVDRQISELEERFLQIVGEWGQSIESKDRYTQGHCRRVADYAVRLALAAGLDEASLVWFRMGALLHDVGKVAVPAEILNKEGPLTPEEWAAMRSHPEAGVELLGDLEFPWDIRPMIRHHHERWDGSGYPDGLAEEDIPWSARILCVADVFDALTTNRSYRAALPPSVALGIMAGDAGHVFDPELIGLFQNRASSFVPGVRAASPSVLPIRPVGTIDSVRATRRPPRVEVA